MAPGPCAKEFRPLAEFILSNAEGLGVTFGESYSVKRFKAAASPFDKPRASGSRFLRHTGVSRCPGKYILHCSLDSGVRQNDGVGSVAQFGVDVDSTLTLN